MYASRWPSSLQCVLPCPASSVPSPPVQGRGKLSQLASFSSPVVGSPCLGLGERYNTFSPTCDHIQVGTGHRALCVHTLYFTNYAHFTIIPSSADLGPLCQQASYTATWGVPTLHYGSMTSMLPPACLALIPPPCRSLSAIWNNLTYATLQATLNCLVHMPG